MGLGLGIFCFISIMAVCDPQCFPCQCIVSVRQNKKKLTKKYIFKRIMDSHDGIQFHVCILSMFLR